jgi:5S rRNA maturation endonuclease (ribonuclease M5)
MPDNAPALDRVRKLPGFHSCGQDQFQACCPSHEDRKASLSIGIGKDGKILLHCHAGCETDKILQALGLESKDLFPESDKGKGCNKHIERKIEVAYDYSNESGNLAYQVLRYSPKGFSQRRPDNKGGWINETKGLKRLPYRLPELLQAEYVFIVEGEKDVENLRKIGLTATCNDGGAGKWRNELNQYFRQEQRITILPDNDSPGRDHAKLVASNLYGKVASVTVLELQGLPEKGDVSDWLKGRDSEGAAEELCRLSDSAPEWKPEETEAKRCFDVLAEDRYRLSIPDSAAVIEVDRLRRERGELVGELAVKCALPGVRSYGGTVSIADFNLSSARARTDRAKLLTSRVDGIDVDWAGYLEELCQRVLAAERNGQPAVDLRILERPGPDDSIRLDDIRLPRRHPTIIFGDGGSAKSYLALYLLGKLAQQGLRVALFDWEMAGEDHRDRLERLFGPGMPKIAYARCQRPLFYEADRLARIVRDEAIEYAAFDSVAFACDGRPEDADVTGRYFQGVRRIGIGGLHVAHITKGEGGDMKPFGSIFWHNGARATYYVKLADSSPDGKKLSIGIFNRKANLSGLYQPTGYLITFAEGRTYFETSNPADTPELADKLSIRQRLAYALRNGCKDLQQVALEIDAEPDTVRRTLRRYKTQFTIIEGGKVGLSQ